MELRSTREMRRNEQLAKTGLAKKGDTAPAASQAAKGAPRQAADSCTLSRQALSYLEQQNRLTRELDERRAREQAKWAKTQNSSGELDIMSKELDLMDKCMKIAASIMKGDKVPLKDLKFLMENDPEGYKLAMALRKQKKDPEEVESVLEDEEPKSDSAGGDEGGEAPSVEASGASGGSSGGGEASSGGETSAPTE